MADHDVEGHLQALLKIWLSPTWIEVWIDADCQVETFDRLGIADDASDAEVWQLCQERNIVLITGNRNAAGEESLEATLRRFGTARSLPVLTIGDTNRLI